MANETLSILAVGDLVPSRRLFPGGQPASRGFGETVDLIHSVDIAFGDLEIPLTTKGHPREKFIAFRADPAIAADLKTAGFDVLCLANNHSLDYSYEGLYETMARLEAQGIKHHGAGQNLDAALAPVIVEVKGRKVGFLAFSALLPTGGAASKDRPGLAPVHVHVAYEVNPFTEMEEPGNPPRVRTWVDADDLKFAQETVRKLRGQVDFLVVSAHIGYGAGDELADYEQPLCRALIDAGADVIFGNHVHALHGIEVYQGKVILYSPGNFIAQQPREGASPEIIALYDDMKPDGYAAVVEVAADGTYSVEITPTSTNKDGLPEVAHGEAARRIQEHLVRLSAKLDTTLAVRGEKLAVVIGRA